MNKNLYGLYPRFHKKYAREYVDCDYIESIPLEVQLWLSQFLDEYYGDRYQKGKEPIHSDKKLTGQMGNEMRRDISAIGYKQELKQN